MTQQEIRLELIKLINIAPEELLSAEKFINGNNDGLKSIIKTRQDVCRCSVRYGGFDNDLASGKLTQSPQKLYISQSDKYYLHVW